jgi:type III restriction enzyme
MKIKFEAGLPHQTKGVDSIVNIFDGQNSCNSPFTVPLIDNQLYINQSGTANKLQLHEDDILNNIHKIQLSNGIKQSQSLGSMNFSIEMETGTGKTYVYLKTIFEMNEKYGFTKFVIVVPSIAIKEGVFKSLEITKDHFRSQYNGAKTSEYFVYDSNNLSRLGAFADSSSIQIMVINIDALRKNQNKDGKDGRIIHRRNDRMNGAKPIDLIQLTNPIVIIDEPQSVDNTPKAKESIATLNPLCTLRYSATHREQYNLLYKLDSIDAYDQQLVKQIEVVSTQMHSGNNKAYVKLISTASRKGKAKIEIDVQGNGGVVKRKKVDVRAGDDLFDVSKERSLYENLLISNISFEEENEYIEFGETILYKDQVIGEVDQLGLKRAQIKRTIIEHLNKEKRLKAQGIKVLSLFFIDKVENYRVYGENGENLNGIYADIFEEEYKKAIQNPKFKDMFESADLNEFASQVHNGYFSKDKKKSKTSGQMVETYKDTTGKTKADEDTFSLIMKDKEKLLSFDSPLRFIFSHSALREGWDNPNVFQICTLNETSTTIKKRQEIGRGLRLAVNQSGVRVHGFDVNTLTVMANESYDEFVSTLQQEISEDEVIKFGIIESHLFATLLVEQTDGTTSILGEEKSKEIYDDLLEKGYINDKGEAQDTLKVAIKEDTLEVPQEFEPIKDEIHSTLSRTIGKQLIVKDGAKRRTVKLNKDVFESQEFFDLWNRVKERTTYRVEFDSNNLIDECAKKIKNDLVVVGTRYVTESGKIVINQDGLTTQGGDTRRSTQVSESQLSPLPDIVSYLQNETNLTRSSIIAILKKCDKLKEFIKNPQKFIEEALKIITSTMKSFIVDGIKYEKTSEFYDQSLFNNEELMGYIEANMLEAKRSVYDYVIYDSEVEKSFAKEFEQDDNVKVYAKLPDWFKIPTPLGNYNPDWAVLYEKNGVEKLFFVVETKGSTLDLFRREKENGKIECGKKHFEALGENANYFVATDMESFLSNV